MTDLTGRKAFILGGSRGIGEAMVRKFGSAGAEVVFTYASSVAEATTLAAATSGRACAACHRAVTAGCMVTPAAVRALYRSDVPTAARQPSEWAARRRDGG